MSLVLVRINPYRNFPVAVLNTSEHDNIRMYQEYEVYDVCVCVCVCLCVCVFVCVYVCAGGGGSLPVCRCVHLYLEPPKAQQHKAMFVFPDTNRSDVTSVYRLLLFLSHLLPLPSFSPCSLLLVSSMAPVLVSVSGSSWK